MLHSPLIEAFERQVAWCRQPSPFTARLLERTRLWLQAHSDTHEAHDTLAAIDADPLAAAVALRWAGALHHLALQGLEPWSTMWPPRRAADAPSDAEFDAAIAEAWHSQRPALQAALALPPQTNEVQRSAALLPGLLHVAARTGRPLALLEIGASAGLNLWCERHRYDYGSWSWGDPAAALQLQCEWRGPAPAVAEAGLRIVQRAACDANPIDLTQPGEALRLTSFVWPDQAERLARLRTAQRETARWLADEGVAVQAQRASDFVAQQLAAAPQGLATVLMHSIVWQYIGGAEQAAIEAAVAAAAARATATSPLAWLRVEPPAPDKAVEIRCRVWPGGDEVCLGKAHPHVAWIESRA